MKRVAVILAVHEPDLRLLRLQIASVLAQEDVEIDLVVTPDGSQAAFRPADLSETHGARLHVLAHAEPIGIYRNFGRGLEAALGLSRAEYFAFSDQDDVWAADKLRRLTQLADETGAVLAYSDSAVIDGEGAMIAPSLKALEARRLMPDRESLAVANSISGMSMVFRRSLAVAAVPFPPEGQGLFLHDWWMASLAVSLGELAHCADPLVQYRAHSANAIGPRTGHGGRSNRPPSSRARQLEVRLTLNRCLKVRLAREGRQLPVDVTDTAHPKLQFGLILARVLWRALRAGDPGMIKAARRLALALILAMPRQHATTPEPAAREHFVAWESTPSQQFFPPSSRRYRVRPGVSTASARLS